MEPIEVVVRDGRMGRDPELVTEEGGEVLMTYRTNHPPMVGQRVTLEDGTEVEIIGMTERISTTWSFVVYVGDVWGT